MTTQELDALQGLCDGITTGTSKIGGHQVFVHVPGDGFTLLATFADPNDAAFFAAARTALPQLIAEAQRLQAEIASNAVFLACHGAGGYRLSAYEPCDTRTADSSGPAPDDNA